MLDPHGSARSGEHDASVVLFPHVRNSGTNKMERRADTDGDHAIPNSRPGFFEVREDHEARLMYQGIEPAEAGNGKLDDALACGRIFQVLIAGGGRPARLSDFCDDSIRDRWIEPATVLGHTGIMDHDCAAASGDQAGVGRTETTPGAGYEDDLTIKADRRQRLDLLSTGEAHSTRRP